MLGFCIVLRNETVQTAPMKGNVLDYPMFSDDDTTTYQRMQYLDPTEQDSAVCTLSFKDGDEAGTIVECSITSSTFHLTSHTVTPPYNLTGNFNTPDGTVCIVPCE